MTIQVVAKDAGLRNGRHGFHLRRCGDERNPDKKYGSCTSITHATLNAPMGQNGPKSARWRPGAWKQGWVDRCHDGTDRGSIDH